MLGGWEQNRLTRMQFPHISVDRFSGKRGCGDKSGGGCRRAFLIEALAAFSGALLYLMSPVSPALDSLPSPLTCVLNWRAQVAF